MPRWEIARDALYTLVLKARRRYQAVKRRLLRRFFVVLIVRTMQELSADDATHMAAGVAYYTLFSLFPLLLGLIAALSFFLESQRVQTELVGWVSQYLPGSSQFVESNLEAVLRIRGALGVFAAIGLLWSGSAIFGAISRAVNRAWDVHRDRPFYISKPRQLLMALGVGVLFLMSVATSAFIQVTASLASQDLPGWPFLYEAVGRTVLQGSSLGFTVSIFLLIYKFMPNTRTYWRYIWPGAVLAAVLFEVAKNVFILYVNQFAQFEHVYGSLAPVIGLLLWTYISSFILILGAELSSEYERLKRGIERGGLEEPAGEERDK